MRRHVRAGAGEDTHPRTRPGSGFKPAADEVRCWAVVYRGSYGFAGRCPYRRVDEGAGDLCGRHHARAAAGFHVKRVKA